MGKDKDKNKSVVCFTEDEAREILLVFRSAGWHRRKELSPDSSKNEFVRLNSHIIKKIEKALKIDD